MNNSDVELSVVMPAYNEDDKIYNNSIHVSAAVAKFCDSYEIVVVNDGSKDATKTETLRAQEKDHYIRLVTYDENGGKGKAIRKGIEAAKGKFIAMLDADLDLPPEQLKDYINVLRADQADVVIGSKMHKDSKIDYPPIRKVMSFGY